MNIASLRRGLFILVLVYGVAALPSCAPERKPGAPAVQNQAGPVGIGSTAPEFTLASAEGEQVSLSEFKGKVVMVNFWATWCPPCKREIPDFIRLQEKFGSRGFEILGIALDEQEAVDGYLTSQPVNYIVLLGTPAIAALYGGVESIPTTFLVDRDGIIRVSEVGMQTSQFWDTKIQELL